MNTEEIVRTLAAKSAPQCDSIPPRTCLLCEAEAQGDAYWLAGPEEHKPDCPWRLAVEWVAANQL